MDKFTADNLFKNAVLDNNLSVLQSLLQNPATEQYINFTNISQYEYIAINKGLTEVAPYLTNLKNNYINFLIEAVKQGNLSYLENHLSNYLTSRVKEDVFINTSKSFCDNLLLDDMLKTFYYCVILMIVCIAYQLRTKLKIVN